MIASVAGVMVGLLLLYCCCHDTFISKMPAQRKQLLQSNGQQFKLISCIEWKCHHQTAGSLSVMKVFGCGLAGNRFWVVLGGPLSVMKVW